MKKTTTLLLATLLGLAACQHESFDERCGREAREYTEKQCPRRMDDYTMMDSLTFDRASRTLTYYYTMEGMLDTDSMATPEFGEALETTLRKHIVNSVDLRSYKKEGLNFCYQYNSKSTGKVRYKVLFTPEDYGNGRNATEKK